jgi:hypothetical protein
VKNAILELKQLLAQSETLSDIQDAANQMGQLSRNTTVSPFLTLPIETPLKPKESCRKTLELDKQISTILAFED